MENDGIDASQIRDVEFREKMRGYHQEDVDEFLEKVAKGVELLEEELAQARKEIEELRSRAGTTGAVEVVADTDIIQRTLLVAQKAADQLREEAERDAEQIRGQARMEADRMLEEARESAAAIEEARRRNLADEIARLEGELDDRKQELEQVSARIGDFKTRLKEELAAMMQLVESSEFVSELLGSDHKVADDSSGTAEPMDEPTGPDSHGKLKMDRTEQGYGWIGTGEVPESSVSSVDDEAEGTDEGDSQSDEKPLLSESEDGDGGHTDYIFGADDTYMPPYHLG